MEAVLTTHYVTEGGVGQTYIGIEGRFLTTLYTTHGVGWMPTTAYTGEGCAEKRDNAILFKPPLLKKQCFLVHYKS